MPTLNSIDRRTEYGLSHGIMVAATCALAHSCLCAAPDRYWNNISEQRSFGMLSHIHHDI